MLYSSVIVKVKEETVIEEKIRITAYLIPWQFFYAKWLAKHRARNFSSFMSEVLHMYITQWASKKEIDQMLEEYHTWEKEGKPNVSI